MAILVFSPQVLSHWSHLVPKEQSLESTIPWRGNYLHIFSLLAPWRLTIDIGSMANRPQLAYREKFLILILIKSSCVKNVCVQSSKSTSVNTSVIQRTLWTRQDICPTGKCWDIINRPGVAGAVLQKTFVTNSFIIWVSHPFPPNHKSITNRKS